MIVRFMGMNLPLIATAAVISGWISTAIKRLLDQAPSNDRVDGTNTGAGLHHADSGMQQR